MRRAASRPLRRVASRPPRAARTSRTALLLLALASLLGGCAWANRANRPVWNAFEEHVVPDGDAAFYATLPLTVPGGLVAIVLDTFIVHPVSVGDDAWGDAGDVWDDIPWREHYYTELAFLPVRVVGTPLLFVGSFLGRSLFDVPPHRTDEEAAAERARLASQRERALVAWLDQLAAGASRGHFRPPPADWTDALDAAWERALSNAPALGRVEAYRYARRYKAAPWQRDNDLGLRDPDPVVRHLLIEHWPARQPISPETRAALLADPSQAVREAAAATWAAPG